MTDDQKRKAIERAQIEGGEGHALFVAFVLNMSKDVQGAMAQHLGLHIEVVNEEVAFHWISEVKN
jgi:hypothetical protein